MWNIRKSAWYAWDGREIKGARKTHNENVALVEEHFVIANIKKKKYIKKKSQQYVHTYCTL